MKLRSLFLAGIAAFAMASCSNEVEGIDNGDNGNSEKNAVMQFRFSYGNTTAGLRDAENTEAGLDTEQTFTTALLVVDYTNGTTPNIVKTIPRTDFTPTVSPSGDGKYYQSTPFDVTDGAVTAYVILNPTSTIASAVNALNGTTTDVPNVLKSLKLNDGEGATSDNFVMYGSGSATLLAEKITPVNVAVDRIVAKMKEGTQTLAYTVQGDATTGNLDKEVTISLNGYTFTNLTDKSNLVYQNENKVTSFIIGSVFDGTAKSYTYQDMGNVANDKQINYYFENENAQGDKAGTNITSIIYRAKITATGINDQENSKNVNVYVYNNTVYNYTTLKEAFPGLTLTDDEQIAEYEKLGIRQYVAGVCYYRQPITTTGAGNVIKRNNVYKLSVTSVSKIGFPTVIPTTDPTMMLLNLEVNKWTVNENAFAL